MLAPLPQFWPQPRHFDPSDFLPHESAARHRYSYLPFAAGHRNCIGATLAVVEAKLIIAQIARRFHLHLVKRALVRPRAGTTMHPSARSTCRSSHAPWLSPCSAGLPHTAHRQVPEFDRLTALL